MRPRPTMTSFHPFVITISDLIADSFRVQAEFQGIARTADSGFTQFKAGELKPEHRWTEAALMDRDYAQDLGQRLFRTLLPGEIASLFREARQRLKASEALRIVINLPLPEPLSALPWELIQDPYSGQGFMARSAGTSLVRRFTNLPLTRPLPSKGSLGVLVAAAAPQGFGHLDASGETEAILQALKRGRGLRALTRTLLAGLRRPRLLPGLLKRALTGRRFQVEIESHASRDNLEARFQAARQGQADPIHVVHLIGHGNLGTAQAEFYLEKDGQADPLSAADLADLAGQAEVQLVVLNACETAAALGGIQSLAQALLQRGVPAVIGMQMPVLDRVAIDFARHFYSVWAAGEPLETAMTEARRWVRQVGRGSPLDWSIPVLYMSQTGGWALKPMQRSAPVVRTLAALPKALVSLAAVFSLLISYLLVFPQNLVEARTKLPILRCYWPVPMSSEHNFNLVVTPPTLVTGRRVRPGNADSRALADFLYQRIQQEFERIDLQIPYDIRPPEHTCTLSGATAEERRAAAQTLAEATGAHVVVYGVITQGAQGWRYSPEFFVSYKGFAQGEQVIGTHTLGRDLPIELPFRPEDFQGVQKIALTERIKALSLIAIGMAHYFSDHPEEAVPFFELAEETRGWSPEDGGKAVISYFLGNARVAEAIRTASLETLEQAGGHYDQALALKPGYARALSGKANILYLLGSGDFSGQEPDPDLLESARERFDAILKMEDPEVADIELNLHFTLGKIHLLQGESGWEQARKEFEFILERYGQLPDKSLEELAGHTYARLGLLAYYGGDLPEAETLLLAAVERVSPHYQASYLGTLAQMFKNKGDPARAIQLYTRAQDITTFYCEDENAEGYYQAIQTLLGMDAPQE